MAICGNEILLPNRIHQNRATHVPLVTNVQCSAKAVDCYDSCSPTLTPGHITQCYALVSWLIQNTLLLFVCARLGWTGKYTALKQTIITTSANAGPLLHIIWFHLIYQLFGFHPNKKKIIVVTCRTKVYNDQMWWSCDERCRVSRDVFTCIWKSKSAT